MGMRTSILFDRMLLPTPNCDLYIAAKKIISLAESREDEKSKKAAKDASSTFGKACDRERTVRGLSSVCNERLSTESKSADDYYQLRISENDFLVKRNYNKFDSDIDADLEMDIDDMNAKFARGEDVKLKEEGELGEVVLQVCESSKVGSCRLSQCLVIL